MWWFKEAAAPPLVSDGFLGQPGTSVLLGGTDVDTNPNPGLRLTAGFALTERWGLESSVLYVPEGSSSRSVSSSGEIGSKDLSIPFFDVVGQGENDTPLSAAGVHAGRATEALVRQLMTSFQRLPLFRTSVLEPNREYYVRISATARPSNGAFLWPWGSGTSGQAKFTFIR